MTADTGAEDRGESTALMEPLLVSQGSRHRGELNDLAVELVQLSSGFRSSLPRPLQAPLADLVRSMNCYYSNLIEGHDTHPVDIERALKNDYSQDQRRRDLQIEAKAHIAVQRWIDEGGLAHGRAVSVEGILEVHRRFCAELPEDLLWVEEPDTRARAPMIPGKLRARDVKVGRHLAVSPGALPRFLERFSSGYGVLGKLEQIVALPAIHHRFLWIHPFLDGNGRVARLMSHALLLEQLDTGGVWSVARGLARNVADYKRLLSDCDSARRNDLDGRGDLSEEALSELTRFFLVTCIDQVRFMENLVEPDRLRARVLTWVEEEIRMDALPSQASRILEAVLHRGELPRSEIETITGTGDRQARRILASLVDRGVLGSAGPRAPVHLMLPAELAQRWMPGLFPPPPPWIQGE